jgi:RNA polymerase sigma-70 factor, ECF subfamily
LKVKDIGDLFDANFHRIYRYFYYKTLNKAEAEDLTSDTFFQIVEKIKKGHKIDNPSHYIFGIARNIMANYLRRKYLLLFVPLEEEHKSMAKVEEFETDRSKFDEYVSKMISKLPSKQRVILQMRLIEKKEFKEVCELLNKGENYVKTTQKRGIKTLKKLISCTPLTT